MTPKHVIIGTAGHIDHGKTSLVKALTGVDTDRLKEEKERGISIELGFAALELGGGVSAGIVDVPGHERFVKTMLAGVGGIDLVVLVIAADEGVMPQTREHLHICQLLHVKRGLVALTKVDLVESDWLELVTADVEGALKGTFLEGAPIVPVSATSGAGLDVLVAALAGIAGEVEPKRTDGIFRMPIDRVFTIKGFGTVVTGTLVSGTVKIGDDVTILPVGAASRARRLQVHGQTVEMAVAGQRTAVNVPGIEVEDLERGNVLCQPNTLRTTQAMEGTLELLPDAPRPLKNRARVRFHMGTVEVLARVVLLDREELAPGQSGLVHLRLEAPTAALPKDRYVLRSYSPAVTIGGGTILDPVPPARRRPRVDVLASLTAMERGGTTDQVEQALRASGLVPVSLEELRSRSGLEREGLAASLKALVADGKVVGLGGRADEAFMHRAHHDKVVGELIARVTEFHGQQPLRDGIAKEELRSKLPGGLAPQVFAWFLAALTAAKRIAVEQDTVRLADFKPTLGSAGEGLRDKLEATYRAAGVQPPSMPEALTAAGGDRKLGQAVFRRMVDDGILLKIKDDLFLHREHYQDLRAKLVAHLKTTPSVSVPGFKDIFGISRKYAIPYLEHFDNAKVTRRQGDERVAYDAA